METYLSVRKKYLLQQIEDAKELYKLKPDCIIGSDIEYIGINRFIMIVKINNYKDYSQNCYLAIDPYYKNNIRKNINILSRKLITSVNDYNIYTLFNNRLYEVDILFIPQNLQIVLLINKNISNYNIKYFKNYIFDYINNRMPEFVSASLKTLATNIKYNNYYYDPLTTIL